MKPADYWIKRSERVLLAGERHSDELIKVLSGFYADTAHQLQTQIDAFYGRYATENGITLAQAHKRLDKRRLKSFRENLEKYHAEAAQLRIGSAYEQSLRNLSTKAAISRYQELLTQARHQIEVLAAKGTAAFSETLEEVYPESYYRTLFDIQYGLGFGADFARMDTKTIERLMRTSWLGDNYSSRIWKNKEALLLQLEQTIPQAFSLGYNSRVLGQRIAARLEVSKHAGERLARTEVNHAANESVRRAYKESGVEEYEFLATLDNRTSDICAALDGKVFRVSYAQTGVNYPPMHPNCRSTTVPYFPPDEFDEPSSRAARGRDGKYYTVPASMTYPEWYEKHVKKKP
jgi:SPP1 gp7 family putative phage head morphogenesis protein